MQMPNLKLLHLGSQESQSCPRTTLLRPALQHPSKDQLLLLPEMRVKRKDMREAYRAKTKEKATRPPLLL